MTPKTTDSDRANPTWIWCGGARSSFSPRKRAAVPAIAERKRVLRHISIANSTAASSRKKTSAAAGSKRVQRVGAPEQKRDPDTPGDDGAGAKAFEIDAEKSGE